MRSIAFRRLQDKRITKNFFADCPWLSDNDKWAIQGAYKTRKPCSNSCCGNPRRHWGLVTMQELRAANIKDYNE